MIKVYTAGTWDLFHVGHLNILKASKKLGDYLVVGVSTDELIFSYKNRYPIIPFEDRFKIIESCKYVNEAVKQEILLGINEINKINPDILTIGSDWKDKYLAGIEYFKKNKKIVYFDYTDKVSSTIIREKLNSIYNKRR
jgi:glycerol-3-phosphate cytidylyltransferase